MCMYNIYKYHYRWEGKGQENVEEGKERDRNGKDKFLKYKKAKKTPS